MAVSRSTGSAMSVPRVTTIIPILLPTASVSSGVRSEMGTPAHTGSSGSASRDWRYVRRPPPTTARMTSLTVAPGTALRICFAVARSKRNPSAIRLVRTFSLSTVFGKRPMGPPRSSLRSRSERTAGSVRDATRTMRPGTRATLPAARASISTDEGGRSPCHGRR